ncbi:enterotoxin A family protein [Paraburkholderia sacchari]|uniref:enterotoxin A family protein n=1 Tax=Paraburkholderia sacchari TaxID=159450 RepID=UPI0039A4D52C
MAGKDGANGTNGMEKATGTGAAPLPAATTPGTGDTRESPSGPGSQAGVGAGPGSGRTPHQTVGPETGTSPTFDAYRSSAVEYNGASDQSLSQASGQPDSMKNKCAGLVSVALEDVAGGKARDLMTATDGIESRLSNSQTRQETIDRVNAAQERNRYAFNADLPGHEARPGEDGLTDGHDLVDEMRSQFSTRHTSSDVRGSEEYTLAEITLAFGNSGGEDHAITVQRLHPSADYENDEYQLYDPNYGAFRYRTFDQLGGALTSLFDRGYPQLGGVSGARTSYFADTATYRPYHDISPGSPSQLSGNSSLGAAAGGLAGHWQVPPNPGLPPPPSFDQPGPSGWQGNLRPDLKRDADSPNPQTPSVFYRPSTLSPEDVKKGQGFFATDTSLRNVNLDAHDAEVSAKSGVVDGSGYLGAFSNEDVAQRKLAAMGSQNGYVYDIAASPNMVDVAGSLGNGNARAPADGEVAAMGSIDWTQVRGWRQMNNGQLGVYQANPDYRWDVYDALRTAGARPELARFSPENPAWKDDAHKAFVTPVQEDGKTLYAPHEDPALTQTRFFANARAKIDREVSNQSSGLDYRGPLTIHPMWNNDGGAGPTRLEASKVGDVTWPYVDSYTGPNTDDRMTFGDDGRIHRYNDYNTVLRIDSSGNAYFGAAPTDPDNTNGVFRYSDGRGLQHVEDGKWLTEGKSAYVPYVSKSENGGLADTQTWQLYDPHGKQVEPPMPRAAFKDGTAGSGEQLYRFYRDADSALPSGTTRFVTRVPGSSEPEGGKFLNLVDKIKPEDVVSARKWLAKNDAAWLFKDGFYAVADGDNGIEVRNLGGTPVWRAQVDGAGQMKFHRLGNGLASDYRMPERPWDQVVESEKRNASLYARAGKTFM